MDIKAEQTAALIAKNEDGMANQTVEGTPRTLGVLSEAVGGAPHLIVGLNSDTIQMHEYLLF